MPRPKQANQTRLAERLKAIRLAKRVSGSALARKIGCPQSRVSKLETAAQVASHEDIDKWAMALDLDADTVAELHGLVDLAQHEFNAWQELWRAHGGGVYAQQAVGTLEQITKVSKDFVQGMIPGRLQTEAYARDALNIPGGPRAWGSSKADCEKIVAARMELQSILREPGREFRFVIGEAALWTRFGSVETLVEQLLQLAVWLEELKSVTLRVMPLGAKWPVHPLATFAIYDDQMVSIEEQAGEHAIVDVKQVEKYIEQFDLLAGAALKPARSVELIREVAERLRAGDVGGMR